MKRRKEAQQRERLWPGAVERGLQQMPDMAPGQIDLTEPTSQCWMNLMAAEHKKGAPLNEAERRRIFRGLDYRPRWRIEAEQKILDAARRQA